jgi:hypothetical protein
MFKSLITGVLLMAGANVYAVTCDDIEFSGDIASTYPNVDEFCREIVERDGESYAKLQARVTHPGYSTLGVQFQRPDGSWGDSINITPPSDFRVQMGGRSYRVRDLERRQEMNVYLKEGREWNMAMAPVDEPPPALEEVVVLYVVEERPEEDTALPKTASLVPLVGLIGAGLLALGLFMRLRRTA